MIPARIPVNSTWGQIHTIIHQINEAMLLPNFDMQLFDEDRVASKMVHITIFANKKTYIDAINDFLKWYYINIMYTKAEDLEKHSQRNNPIGEETSSNR